MLKKNKYDIFEEKLKEIGAFTNTLSNKIMILESKKLINIINDNDYKKRKDELIMQSYPYIEMLSHIGYENSLDILNVPLKTILFYLYDTNLGFTSIMDNYHSSIDKYVKNILQFSLINIITQNDEEKKKLYLEIRKKGIDSLDISDINADLYHLINKTKNGEFTINSLNGDEINYLNNYHNNYLAKNIKTEINNNEYNDADIAKVARKIMKK